MKMNSLLLATTASFSLMLGTLARADEITALDAPELPLFGVTFKGGKAMDLSVGYASGAFHRPGDAKGTIWAITDRGPNIDCAEAGDLTGGDAAAMCAGDESGKIFPVPEFDPTIYALEIAGGKIAVKSEIPLKGTDGAKLSGLSIGLTQNPTEPAFDKNGAPIAQTPNGFDSESIVALADGSFWISDEYGPSIAHVAADGTVLDRLVPAGTEGDYAKADYPASGVLPAIIARRTLNRGIESIAVSPDEKTLYFALQSPLSNPDKDAYKSSRLLRLFKFDPATKTVLGEYAYQLDLPESFKADNAKKTPKQSDVKVSEMVAVGADKLMVLERISKTTKLYIVDLAGATPVPAAFDAAATAPTLEQLGEADLAGAGVVPLTKALAFDSDDHKGMPSKIEGIAMMDPTHLVVMNDNDFGIEGAKTQAVEITLSKALGE